ncbi:hypothetical protein AUR59_020325 [Stutzerimonas balearica]|uniref:hypothetical protein n=1 Tax=Stutzerimonas balearica TaxID=74829 RepID=UPI000970F3CD|nr:hypothetical protein [Stutzerimonas balearica]OMG61507.1 hypothetical protein AUR59_020325 [Stutzerimonas balearica]
MNDTLKAAGRIGAELGAAKAENDRLRRLLEAALYYVPSNKTELRALIDAALFQKAEPDCVACEGRPAACNNPCALCGKHAEPTDTYTAVDMATAAAQGFRDGQAAVEQAAVKDEREAFEAWMVEVEGARIRPRFDRVTAGPFADEYRDGRIQGAWNVWQARAARPAQTEQQPPYPHEAMDVIATSRYQVVASGSGPLSRYYVRAGDGKCELYRGGKSDCEHVARKLAGAFLDGGLTAFGLYAAPIAQTAPQPEQSEELAWKVLQAATDALDRRAAPHAWISQAWNAGSEVITSRRAAKPTQGASEQ